MSPCVVAGGVTIGLRGGGVTATLADEVGAAIAVAHEGGVTKVQYTGSSGLCVAVTSERAVLQRKVAAGPTAAGKATVAADEVSRAVLPNGATVRYLADGATEILHANGNLSRREAGGAAWVGTNLAGVRWAQADPHEAPPPPPPPPPADPEAEAAGDEKDAAPAPDPPAAEEGDAPGAEGRGSHSFTFQLNLSRF